MEAQEVKPQEVTKEWLAARVNANPSKVIGRALLAIYSSQTEAEQSSSATRFKNGVGFSKPDARVGSIGARMFQAHGVLDSWLIKLWVRPSKDGLPRICKYAGQLNEIAKQKQRALEAKKSNGTKYYHAVIDEWVN